MTNVQIWPRRIPRIYTEDAVFGIEHQIDYVGGRFDRGHRHELSVRIRLVHKQKKDCKRSLMRNTCTFNQDFQFRVVQSETTFRQALRMTNVQIWPRRIPRIYTQDAAFGIELIMQAEG